MKLITTALGAASLLALAACNQQDAGNAAAGNEANAASVDANAASTDANAAKPAGEAAATGNEAAPAGDKPAADANATTEAAAPGEAGGDKPTE